MTRENKDFLTQHWQKLMFVVLFNLIVTIASNYTLNSYLMKQATEKNEQQDMSIFQLQLNQTFVASKTNLDLPYKLTVTRSGNN